MNYLSTFSGIEAASVAWHPLGFKPVGFSEIEPFPSAVLAHRFPQIKNYGDINTFPEWGIEPGSVDILVGGSPCQSFSAAGLRAGLADPRGNLALVFAALAHRIRPRWIIWENVPGVLSSNGGRDFASFLESMAIGGLVGGWRVLNSRFFGVPQSRRRVFALFTPRENVEGVARVLFERGSTGLSNTTLGRPGEDSPAGVPRCFTASSFGTYREGVGTLKKSGHDCGGGSENLIVYPGEEVGRTIRRMTPREAERLQGFPDDWTRIPWKGKSAEDCPDAPRYAACGNSMAVPVMHWIGSRLKAYEEGTLE